LAFTAKNTTLFVGWSAVPTADNANRAARYLFSRAFGEQIFAPGWKNRPFPFNDAVEGLASKGWNTSPSPYTGFTASASPIKLDSRGIPGDTLVLFRPTIGMKMYVSADGKHLHIPGSFGDKQGTVTIHGFSANAEEWSGEDGIVVGIEDWSWGDVVVTVDGKKSQALPLCMWHGRFSATGTNPGGAAWGPKIDITCTAIFRADVHPYHATPDTDLVYDHAGADFEPDTTGTLTVHSGQYLDAANKLLTKWNDKTVTLDFRQNASANAARGIVDLDSHEGTASFILSGDTVFSDYQVFDAETGALLFTEQFVVSPSFMATADMGMMGTIEATTVTDPTGLQVTIPQMKADPMTDFDDALL
jgi:hypothetical protein